MTDNSIVKVLTLPEPPLSRREIIRYAGGGEDSGETAALVSHCISEALPQMTYKVCYKSYPVSAKGNELDLGFARVVSDNLQNNLKGCGSILLFAATVGIEIDRLIMKYGRISPAKALIMQAIGAERIESLCDVFCEELKKEGLPIRPRFSPGYGDLSLELQKEIFSALDCPKRIGLTLNSSMLMSPTKSVTAIVGIEE